MNVAPAPSPSGRKFSGLHVLLVVIILLLAAILGSLWWLQRNTHASPFAPVELAPEKQALLDAKLNAVDPSMAIGGSSLVEPGVYSEEGARRKIVFTQDELNAVLGKDPDLARQVKFHLSDQLVSVQFLAPVEPGIPLIGGRTYRLSMGLGLSYTNEKPSVIVRGISIGGIPLPAAWWGDIKNKNLVEAFGEEEGFWSLFSRGVDYLEVTDGKFILHLRE